MRGAGEKRAGWRWKVALCLRGALGWSKNGKVAGESAALRRERAGAGASAGERKVERWKRMGGLRRREGADKQADRQTDRQERAIANEQTNEWTNEWTNERAKGRRMAGADRREAGTAR